MVDAHEAFATGLHKVVAPQHPGFACRLVSPIAEVSKPGSWLYRWTVRIWREGEAPWEPLVIVVCEPDSVLVANRTTGAEKWPIVLEVEWEHPSLFELVLLALEARLGVLL